MNLKPNSILFLFSLLVFSYCSSKDETLADNPLKQLELEVVDSLKVDELVPLRLQDYSPEAGMYILFDSKSQNPFLVNEKGEILNKFDLKGEGPNGTGGNGAFGYKFLDKDRFVAQGAFTDILSTTCKGIRSKK